MANERKDGDGLTRRQRLFVESLVANGGDRLAAAIRAGYSRSSASQRAYELMRMPSVQSALQASILQAVSQHAPQALGNLVRLSRMAQSEQVQFSASKDLLDRAGFREPIRHEVRPMSIEQIDARIIALITELGEDLPLLTPEQRALLPPGVILPGETDGEPNNDQPAPDRAIQDIGQAAEVDDCDQP